MRYERRKRNILGVGGNRRTRFRNVCRYGTTTLGDSMSKFELTGSGKGSKRRPPQVTKRELELREQLWREKDEKKKAKIRKELEGLL